MALKRKIASLEKRQNEMRIEESRRLCTPAEVETILRLLRERPENDFEKYPIYGYPCAANYQLLSDEIRAEVDREQQRVFGKNRK